MEQLPLSRDGSIHVTDERFNAASHLAAACFAVVGTGLLVAQASVHPNPWKIASLAVYGLSLIVLFTASALHHGIDRGPRVNEILRTIDYDSVFLLIAGTATPLVLVLFRTVYGWTVLGGVWTIAVLGIVLRSVWRSIPKWVTNTLYIVLGWMAALLAGVASSVPLAAVVLMAAGGVAYTVGFVVYVVEKPNPRPGVFGFHEVWHVLVVLAALLHYLLIYFYVLPV